MKKVAALLTMLTVVAFAAPADARVRAGLLNCTVAPGVSFIVGSQKTMECHFRPVRGRGENYSGRITRLGLDVGFTSGGKIAWAVYAPARRGPGALAGVYGGASAEANPLGYEHQRPSNRSQRGLQRRPFVIGVMKTACEPSNAGPTLFGQKSSLPGTSAAPRVLLRRSPGAA